MVNIGNAAAVTGKSVQTHIFERRMASIDKGYNILVANKSFLSYFEREGVRIFALTDFVHPDDLNEFKEFIKNSQAADRSIVRFMNSKQEYRYNIIRIRANKQGADGMYVDLEIMDIEETLWINENAVADISKFRMLMSMTGESFFSYNRNDNMFRMFRYENAKRIMIYKMDLDEWKGDMLDKGYVSDEEKGMFLQLISELKSYPPQFTIKLSCSICTKGEINETLRISGALYNGADSEKVVIGRIAQESLSVHTINAVQIMDELQYDSLTGVYNKKTITDAAIKLLKEEKHNKITIVVLDVDHFKNVNDTYGHLYGDKVLARVGQKLKEVVGEDGIVGRIGGDEFMLVLNGINDDQMLRSVLRAVRTQVKWEFAEDFADFSITCSIGAAISPNNGHEFEDLFQKADYCLYVAKEKGRDRYVFFRDEIHRQSYEASIIQKETNKQLNTREVKELSYMRKFMSEALVNKNKAVREVLEHMCTTYNLESINIYYGENMDRVYTVGKVLNDSDNAYFVRLPEYKELLNGGTYVKVGFTGKISNQFPEFCEFMNRRRVSSTLQCIIGSPDNIKGVITFNRCKESAQWADYEVDCAIIFASFITMLADREDD